MAVSSAWTNPSGEKTRKHFKPRSFLPVLQNSLWKIETGVDSASPPASDCAERGRTLAL